MEKRSVEAIVQTLNDAGVRYLIVGGLAAVAHGVLRLTADIDVVLDFEPSNLVKATRALKGLGYKPRAPVPLEKFADEQERERWIREKGMVVFSLFSGEHEATEIDLFVQPPFDFDRAYRSAFRAELGPGVSATFVGIDELIALKEKAGRPKDLEDIGLLKEIRKKDEN